MKLKSLFTFALFSLFLTACEKAPEQIALEGKTMGTTYHVKYIVDGKTTVPNQSEVQKKLDELLVIVNNEMSTYQKDSQISTFNQFHEVDRPFAVSQDFAEVTREAIRLNKVTEGALDVTVGPLVNLWGFGPDKRLNRAPSEEQIQEKAKFVGIEKLAVTDQNELVKKEPNLYLDLSSIAKGFGVDKLATYLESLGLQNYLVEIGGELRGKGKNLKGQAWRIAIEQPALAQGTATQIVVPLDNLAMATSGDYRNYFEDEQGNRQSHIIDPKQKRPISHNLASITVFAPNTMTADGLSTGLFVLGADKALEVAEREQLPIFLILKENNGFTTRSSSAFDKLIK